MTDLALSGALLRQESALPPRLSVRLAALPAVDRRLILAFVTLSLAPLALGLAFGLVVAPLSFHRRTLDITPLTGADGVLRVRAVLVSGAGAPFSVVVETYSRALIAVTPPDR